MNNKPSRQLTMELHNTRTHRNLTVELLRVLFMWLILLLHYLIHGLGYHVNEYVNIDNVASFPFEMSLIGICNIGVTGFMFISGYYGIKYRPERLFSLWLQAAFYFLCLTLVAGLLTGQMHYGLLAKFLLPFTNGGWWFLMCYVFVYILSPIINKGVTLVAREEFKWILILIGFMLYVGRFLSGALSTEFILLLYIYILGRYFKIHGWPLFRKYSTGLFVAGLFMLIIVPYILGMYGASGLLGLFFSNYNPVVAVTAISLFFVAEKHTWKQSHPFVLSMCANTLAAYIITDYPPMREWLIDRFVILSGHSFVRAFVCVTIALVVCLLFEECRKRAMSPLERAMSKRLSL